ncbi:putative gustatory receptor 28a isoform X2 [Microplitis mediator]|uniref:putative gustatory receptor 28a isoform X2 n=1 Tax=Microplitis mediator TaxID=375433 RepID=UPI002554D3F2|nr:putative gustatory receptor 28a isoform X2 [Microplitis mediator]
MYYNKYQPVHQQNLTLIQYIFFKIIGLSPWTINNFGISRKCRKVSNVQNDICYLSYSGIFYNIMLFIGMVSLVLNFTFYQTMHHETRTDNLVTAKTLTGFQFLASSEIMILFAIYTFRQKVIIAVLNKLKSMDDKLQKCGVFGIDNDYTIHLIFTINFLLSCCFLITDSYHYPLLMILMRRSPAILYSWLIIQFTMLLDIIDKRFKILNSMIEKLSDIENQSETLPSILKMPLLNELVIHKITDIKSAYVELSEIGQKITDFYGLFCLMAIKFIGTASIFVTYFLMMFFLGAIVLSTMVWLTNGIWLLWMTFQIIVFTTYVTRTMKQSNNTGKIINKFMDQSTMDEKVEKEMVKFLRNLPYLKIEFTACDVISIDRTLIGTFVGTIATYLIILIQFRLSPPSG